MGQDKSNSLQRLLVEFACHHADDDKTLATSLTMRICVASLLWRGCSDETKVKPVSNVLLASAMVVCLFVAQAAYFLDV